MRTFQTLLEQMFQVQTLSEGWKDVYQQFVATDKVPEDVFQKFREADPSGTQKYLSWANAQYVQDPTRVSHIIDVMRLFYDQVKRGTIKKEASDIYQYTVDQADEIAQQSGVTKTKGEVKRQTKSESTIVVETDDYLIVVPESHGASCFYGANTKWCISGKTAGDWDDYWELGVKIYIVIDKRQNVKYAIAVYRDGKMKAFNEKDEPISISTIEKAIGVPIGVDIAKPATSKEWNAREQQRLGAVLEQGTKNSDGTYSFAGDLDLSDFAFQKLPVRFREVGGDFTCADNQLTSLEGVPKSVGGDFFCDNNQLTSLEGVPQSIDGHFYCDNNQLTSLEGAPSEVGGTFYCHNNKLTSLEGAPKSVGGDFRCSNNQLTSLEGAPQSIDGNFYCDNNQLTSLEGAPSEVGGDFHCRSNPMSVSKLKSTVTRTYL